jgi:tRNA G18 (ribose-2'-O)-methylase SpoU
MQPIGEPFSNYTPVPQMKKPMKLSLVLDSLRSTLNVGSIIRSANGAGVEHIFCCGTTPTPDHTKIVKSSLGAEIDIDWSYSPNAHLLIRELISQSWKVLVLESTPHATSLFSFRAPIDLHQKYALVIGNEISGVDPEIIKIADQILEIPMVGTKTSLNVAVSAGIGIYQLLFGGIQN